MIRFCVVPGYVTSRIDGDRHWVGSRQLANLYCMRPGEYMVHPAEEPFDRYPRCRDLPHYYPRADGNYQCVQEP